MTKKKKAALAWIAVEVIAVLAFFALTGNAFATNEKIYICHAAGQDGTTKYVTLHLPPQAVFGNGGHFNESGTPQAGHEDDYMGQCIVTPPIPVDLCDNIEGVQEEIPPGMVAVEGVCTTPEPPPCQVDCEPEPPVEPPVVVTPPRCPPPNPDGTYGGKDGKPGNDECKADPIPPTLPPLVIDVPTTPPPTVVSPPPVSGKPKPQEPSEQPTENTTPQPSSGEKPKPQKPESKPEKELVSSSAEKGTLPYTGLPLLPIAIFALFLIALGMYLKGYRIVKTFKA